MLPYGYPCAPSDSTESDAVLHLLFAALERGGPPSREGKDLPRHELGFRREEQGQIGRRLGVADVLRRDHFPHAGKEALVFEQFRG